jgi:hypothetical protein
MKKPEEMDEYERAGFDLPKVFKQKVDTAGIDPRVVIQLIRDFEATPQFMPDSVPGCDMREAKRKRYIIERERRTR